jgi:hypothetical protein
MSGDVPELDSELILSAVVFCAFSSILGAGQEESVNLIVLFLRDVVLLLYGKSPLDHDRSTFSLFTIETSC